MNRKKTLIPYLSSDYNKNVENFQLEKIKSMQKDELLSHLRNQESWIYDCYLREKSINLLKKTGGFIATGLSEDDLYKRGVEVVVMQIEKKYFFDLNNHTTEDIIRKVTSRLKNNIINYFSNTRKVNYFQFLNFLNQIEDSCDIFEEIISEIDLKNIDDESIKNGLKKVWEDSTKDMGFNLIDFQDLCNKFGFDPIDVLIYDPWIVPQMSKESCNNSDYQLLVLEDLA